MTQPETSILTTVALSVPKDGTTAAQVVGEAKQDAIAEMERDLRYKLDMLSRKRVVRSGNQLGKHGA